MKKYFIVLAILLLLLTGCSSKNITDLDIKKSSKALDKKYTNMEVISDEQLDTIYGIDTNLMEEYVIKSSIISNGDFYAIMKVDKEDKNTVKNQMNNMFKIMEEQSNLYSPDGVRKIKNRLETEIGNNLIYIISDNNSEVYDILKGYIK